MSTSQLLPALAVAAVAVVVAAVVRRRTAPPPPVRTGRQVPDQLRRNDFDRPEAPWLVVQFSSATCLSCQGTWEKVALLESGDVAVMDVPFQTRRDLHERYAIDAVPLVVVADAEGVVRRHFLGPPSAADLWSSLAELRET